MFGGLGGRHGLRKMRVVGVGDAYDMGRPVPSESIDLVRKGL